MAFSTLLKQQYQYAALALSQRCSQAGTKIPALWLVSEESTAISKDALICPLVAQH